MMSALTRAYALAALLAFAACTTPLKPHRAEPADLGAAASEADIVSAMARPGVVTFEKMTVADWHFPNTTRPPGTTEWNIRQLDAQIYFYAIRHPRFGLYLIDAGMPADYESHMGLLLRRTMHQDYDFHL